MTQAAVKQRYTFTEWLTYNDGADTRYELVDGELIPMDIGKGKHGAIADFLNDHFKAEISRQSQPWTSKIFSIGVRSPRAGRWDTARIPDLVVLEFEQWEAMLDREAVIELYESPPILVVEIVSDSTRSQDYKAKRAEYAVLNILEYWVVDPIQQQITVFKLDEGIYEGEEFANGEVVESAVFSDFKLTATQVLSAKM
ncbi:Uma2 family endonuclease [Microcoleus sp. FACHB-1515]|uniref:Uma2 family endonuclease n=1 Tax=Cyanophyceae TaxID=3028117 RepID=UPI001689E5EB|nr:Uma2 family endonuclease [Microcoleus sp. FACHB-1515]MBD2088335.1 Uma2 family endonuclease [Microcoleus sp. FACHB-1515]